MFALGHLVGFWAHRSGAVSSLLIHDAFGGTGNLSGRVTVPISNGNNWVSIAGTTSLSGGTVTLNAAGNEHTIDAAQTDTTVIATGKGTTNAGGESIHLVNRSQDDLNQWRGLRVKTGAGAQKLRLYSFSAGIPTVQGEDLTPFVDADVNAEFNLRCTSSEVELWITGDRGAIAAVPSTLLNTEKITGVKNNRVDATATFDDYKVDVST